MTEKILRVDWLKVFFKYTLNEYNEIKELFKAKQIFKSDLIFKSEFLDRLIEVYPEENRTDLYWKIKQMKTTKIIKELPKKKIWIDKNKLFNLCKRWELDFKRNTD